MFKIDKDPKFWAPVSVRLPGEEPQTFRARFKVLQVADFGARDLTAPEQVDTLLRDIVIEVDDIETDADFSGDILDTLIANPVTRAALLRGYLEAITEAARGN